MALGAGVGVVIGVILGVSQPAIGDYSIGQIIGLLSLALGAVGLAIGAAVALLLDRIMSKRVETVEAKHTTVELEDE